MLSLLSQCRCVFVFFIFHAGYLTKVCVYVRAHTHTLQYAGCHSYQNANLTASLLQTTFTQKKSCSSFHSSLHPLFYLSTYCWKMEHIEALLHNTIHACVCVCVYLTYVCTLHVCTLPWLQAGLTGVITSKPPSQQAKRERNGLKVNTHTH